MNLRFAANLNFLFKETGVSLLERMRLACECGFKAVEIPFPASDELESIGAVLEQMNIEVALMNIAVGSGDLENGSACVPGSQNAFHSHLNKTICLAKHLKCKKIHIMSGKQPACGCYHEYLQTYKDNLRCACKVLQENDIVGVIEPINKYALPGYFLNNFNMAIDIVQELKSPHLRLLVDVFHLQHINGNLTHFFNEYKHLIGHVQIAQVPHRHEPDTVGELNFAHVFELIARSGYTDWIGCEYKPKTTTVDGLKWVSAFNLKL